MKKLIFCWSWLGILLTVNAQNLTDSPYSGIGIGDIRFDQNVVLSSMAGTSSTASSEFGSEVNFFNPAANQKLIFASFSATLGNNFYNFKADNLDANRSTSYLSEISLAFPVSNKVKFGVGFQPYSGVGYNATRLYEETNPSKAINISGDGGLNSLHSFVTYNANENLSLGLRSNYLFGTIVKGQIASLEGADLRSNYNNNLQMRGLRLVPGIYYNYELPKKENTYFSLGATYQFKTKLSVDREFLSTTFFENAQGQPTQVDTIQYIRDETNGHIGSGFTAGIAFNKRLKYHFALEGQYYYKPDYSFENQFYELENSYRVAFGSWFIPNINTYKSYFQKMVYRFGAYYQKGDVIINDKVLDEFGITFGFGLPVGKSGRRDPSMVNLGFEFGRRGTKSSGLIQENFANLKIGLNFNDQWFKRRKYN